MRVRRKQLDRGSGELLSYQLDVNNSFTFLSHGGIPGREILVSSSPTIFPLIAMAAILFSASFQDLAGILIDHVEFWKQ